MNKKVLEKSINSSLRWFMNSGVMNPSDGSWGVAERVLLTKDNETLEKTLKHFSFYSEEEGHVILEHRRPDCNFQTALLFLLAGDYFNNSKYSEIGENILSFLFNRSGLLNKHNKRYEADTWPIGCWGWTHGSFYNSLFFFDDNAWNLTIQLIIAERYPELEKRYNLLDWSAKLAERLADAFEDQFLKEPTAKHPWSGELDSPHWGSLVCMALSMAYKKFNSTSGVNNKRYLRIIEKYHEFIVEKEDSFSTSEYAYIIIGACFSAKFADKKYANIAEKFGEKLLKASDEDGITPSQWNEAPKGEKLIDLIYTMNWSLMALKLIADLTEEEKYINLYNKQLKIITEIQDDSEESHLNGKSCIHSAFL